MQRGARVIAVDRSPLRDDLMRSPRVTFHQGDAFRFVPEAPVDWLLCDVIAAPERSIGLVLEWVRERRCRYFVVTIKFKGRRTTLNSMSSSARCPVGSSPSKCCTSVPIKTKPASSGPWGTVH